LPSAVAAADQSLAMRSARGVGRSGSLVVVDRAREGGSAARSRTSRASGAVGCRATARARGLQWDGEIDSLPVLPVGGPAL